MNKDVEGAALLPAMLLPLLVGVAMEQLGVVEFTSLTFTAMLGFNFVWCIAIVVYLVVDKHHLKNGNGEIA